MSGQGAATPAAPAGARPATDMVLRIVTPVRTLPPLTVAALVAEGPAGSFALLPRHVDLAGVLVPTVLVCRLPDGRERFVGIDGGTIVKCGAAVTVATRAAIPGDDLAALERQVAARFRRIDAEERSARNALARLEAGIVRRFLDIDREAP